MQASETAIDGPSRGGGGREERWRLTLLGLFLAAVAAFLALAADKAPLNGQVDPAGHMAAQSRQEAARVKAEVDLRFKQGVVMLHAKQYEHALTAFHQVLKLAPQMPEAHVNAGYALLGLGEFKAARDFFESATNLRPGQLNAYFGLAEALEALGDSLGALQAMETYVHLAPKDDPFRVKAQAAAWELRAKLDKAKAAPGEDAARPKEKP